MTDSAPGDDRAVVVRPASERDTPAMLRVEAAAHALLVAQSVDLHALEVPEAFEEPATWSLALVAEVAEVGGDVVGVARLTALDRELLCLDQVSVHPDFARRGVGSRLLAEVAARARQQGYTAITGTTFRDVAFNGPFYSKLGAVEDRAPHPVLLQRRRAEQALGLDRLGARVIMRVTL